MLVIPKLDELYLILSLNSRYPQITMPPKSNSQKKKEAEAAGKAPKKTKQQENAGKSAK